MGMDCPLYTPLGEWPGGNVRIMYSPCCDGLEPYEMHWDTGESVFLFAEKLDFETCGACDDGFKLLGRPYMIEVNEEYDDDFVSVLQVDGNDDWGKEYGVMLKFDPVERTQEWEDCIYDVEVECEKKLKGESRGMGFCFSYWSTKRAVLAKHGIDWCSPPAPESPLPPAFAGLRLSDRGRKGVLRR